MNEWGPEWFDKQGKSASYDTSLLSTDELERQAAHLHAHNELFGLDENEQANLDAILAELDQRGAL